MTTITRLTNEQGDQRPVLARVFVWRGMMYIPTVEGEK